MSTPFDKSAGKARLHPRNPHRERYNLAALAEVYEALKPFVRPNKFGDLSIDFFDAHAVMALNAAILKKDYGIDYWRIPDGYLCPAIPGRADLIHYAADLLEHKKHIAKGPKIRALDIGVGANCVYPIVGRCAYGWSFVGADVDQKALDSAQAIIDANGLLTDHVELRKQEVKAHILRGVVRADEYFDLCVCNPPFFESAAEADRASQRKVRNLKNKRQGKPKRNFAGKAQELWCPGGERAFVAKMIDESEEVGKRVHWFTTLVSKEDNIPFLNNCLTEKRVSEVCVIEMGQGNKRSRILAWTFLNDKQRKLWKQARWT